MASDTVNDSAIKAKRPRSPNYPFVSLDTALQRLAALETYFGRHAVPANKAGLAWGMKGDSSQAGQTLAALKGFGFVDYSGSGDNLQASLTDDARTYLRAQQDDIKQKVVKRAALKPKILASYFEKWGIDRPPNPVCLDELALKGGFTDAAAESFLKVYDGTIAFAKLADSDTSKAPAKDVEPAVDSGNKLKPDGVADDRKSDPPPPPPPTLPRKDKGVVVMEGERELTTGMLSKGASFRLIVTGTVGEKEIERLIKKLELDKEILADGIEDEG